MSAAAVHNVGIAEDHLAMLKSCLKAEYVQHLPPLLDTSRPPEEQASKNMSRAFGAFILSKLCKVSPEIAGKAVIDDFADCGIDVIHFDNHENTLFLIQAKFKPTEQFKLDDALKFTRGIRNLINGEYGGFNINFQNRLMEIDQAVDECAHIQLVIGYVGKDASAEATRAIREFMEDEDHDEERFNPDIIHFDHRKALSELRAQQAYPRIDATIKIASCQHITEPHEAYFGMINITELIDLHDKHKYALYEKNIRHFLGQYTSVNNSIRNTLETEPELFFFLNNGVTALGKFIDPKLKRKEAKKIIIHGLSIINGAQTIATSANLKREKPHLDLSSVKVFFTLIKSDNSDFGKSITEARNHQNPVSITDFVALHDEQERLRRDIAYLGYRYQYKVGSVENQSDPLLIRVGEAAVGLAIMQNDPRFVYWLKKDSLTCLRTDTPQYKALFTPDITPYQLVNAVLFWRYIQARMGHEYRAAPAGSERLTYKHGDYAIAWMLSKQFSKELRSTKIINTTNLPTVLSRYFDAMRQKMWDVMRSMGSTRSPLTNMRTLSTVLSFLEKVTVAVYELDTDPVIQHKKREVRMTDPYPRDLFNYIISKAPQIEGLV